MANRMLTKEETFESVDASVQRCAEAEGMTKEEFYAALRDEWNAAIASNGAFESDPKPTEEN